MSKAEAVKAVNLCFRMLYRCDLWLSAEEANQIGAAGITYLSNYCKLAKGCHGDQLPYFPLHPKLHALCHCFRTILIDAGSHGFALNPLSDSVQQDEDFVGRLARISRRVETRTIATRTIQRYLVATRQVWLFSAMPGAS